MVKIGDPNHKSVQHQSHPSISRAFRIKSAKTANIIAEEFGYEYGEKARDQFDAFCQTYNIRPEEAQIDSLEHVVGESDEERWLIAIWKYVFELRKKHLDKERAAQRANAETLLGVVDAQRAPLASQIHASVVKILSVGPTEQNCPSSPSGKRGLQEDGIDSGQARKYRSRTITKAKCAIDWNIIDRTTLTKIQFHVHRVALAGGYEWRKAAQSNADLYRDLFESGLKMVLPDQVAADVLSKIHSYDLTAQRQFFHLSIYETLRCHWDNSIPCAVRDVLYALVSGADDCVCHLLGVAPGTNLIEKWFPKHAEYAAKNRLELNLVQKWFPKYAEYAAKNAFFLPIKAGTDGLWDSPTTKAPPQRSASEDWPLLLSWSGLRRADARACPPAVLCASFAADPPGGVMVKLAREGLPRYSDLAFVVLYSAMAAKGVTEGGDMAAARTAEDVDRMMRVQVRMLPGDEMKPLINEELLASLDLLVLRSLFRNKTAFEAALHTPRRDGDTQVTLWDRIALLLTSTHDLPAFAAAWKAFLTTPLAAHMFTNYWHKSARPSDSPAGQRPAAGAGAGGLAAAGPQERAEVLQRMLDKFA